jgi:hypothetical protein
LDGAIGAQYLSMLVSGAMCEVTYVSLYRGKEEGMDRGEEEGSLCQRHVALAILVAAVKGKLLSTAISERDRETVLG